MIQKLDKQFMKLLQQLAVVQMMVVIHRYHSTLFQISNKYAYITLFLIHIPNHNLFFPKSFSSFFFFLLFNKRLFKFQVSTSTD